RLQQAFCGYDRSRPRLDRVRRPTCIPLIPRFGREFPNNIQGNLAVDPLSHNVYDIYASGQPGILKAKTFTANHIFVSRSTDAGKHWTSNLVFQLPPPATFDNVFPAIAVDPANGNVYATFSEGHHVYFSMSSHQGKTWAPAV